MKIGIAFPQYEIGTDPGPIKAFVQAAEGLGFDYLLIYTHVLGAAPTPERQGHLFYDHTYDFHEPLILSAFLASVTERIEFSQGVLIMGQRQTVLLAKQAAELDVLSQGRLRLVCGIGYQKFEYDSLGIDYHTRGARSEEQIQLMRALWRDKHVTFSGRWHTVDHAGISPLPINRGVPVWLGGTADAVMRRAARVADGFLIAAASGIEPGPTSLSEAEEIMGRLHGYLRGEGRDPGSFGIEARVAMANWRTWMLADPDVARVEDTSPEECAAQLEAWRALGLSHMSFNTIDTGMREVDRQIDAMERFMGAVDPGLH